MTWFGKHVISFFAFSCLMDHLINLTPNANAKPYLILLLSTVLISYPGLKVDKVTSKRRTLTVVIQQTS
jgi:hypothetical protein